MSLQEKGAAPPSADGVSDGIDTSYLLSAPAEAVWELVADFGAIDAWWPADGPVAIERVENEGTGIGAVRHIWNRGFAHPISERLEALAPERLAWRLSIVGERPAGLLWYEAEGRLVPLGTDACRLEYRARYRVAPGREAEARAFLSGCYDLMARGLSEAARRRAGGGG
ncbi:MAG: hypothetical protein KatS3mg124_1733 [Porticoccaceae bacterium]|nr:MAG: hypothetical protein KatS3mg124_1733 [Porticoccaceae bacterium]